VRCALLLVSGSLRTASTNTAVLRTARDVAPAGTAYTLYDELSALPHFNPDADADPLVPIVVRLRNLVHRADALLFSTPEYAGALPGSLKNLLEWLIGDDHPGSIYEKPVAWVNASTRGVGLAHASLRAVLGYAKANVVEAACVELPVAASSLGPDGLLSDARERERLRGAVAALVARACRGT